MLVSISLPFPGVTAYLNHFSRVVGSKHITLQSNTNIQMPKDATVIIGAWHPIYRDLIPRIQNKKGVLWTSSAGEMGLEANGVEIIYLAEILRLLDGGKIDFILFADPGLAKVFDRDSTYWIPCPIATDLVKYEPINKIDGVGFFTPQKLSKAMFNNLLAVKLIQRNRDTKLHTNIRGYENVTRMLKIDAEIYDWLPMEQYHKLLSSVKVNLAVSWAGEYFNYQVIEAALLGTPSVVNSNADYYPIEELKASNPDDPGEIADRIDYALDHPELGEKARKSILELAEGNNARVRVVLQTFL